MSIATILDDPKLRGQPVIVGYEPDMLPPGAAGITAASDLLDRLRADPSIDAALSSAVDLKKPGQKVTVQIERNGLTQDIDATLGVRPKNP